MKEFKVYVATSLIPAAGKGLFAKRRLEKNEEICIYSGKLIDCVDAKYVDPSYMVEFELGKGFKLIGDNLSGDPGIYANSLHPLSEGLSRNARFDLGCKKYLVGNRGCFAVRAIRTIEAGEEIIVNYGSNYWATLERWCSCSMPIKPASALAREERAVRRQKRFFDNVAMAN